MIRTCDGTDLGLVRTEEENFDEPPPLVVPLPRYVPCACGLTFDDVGRSVVWPHAELLPPPSPGFLVESRGLSVWSDHGDGSGHWFFLEPPEVG